MGKKSEIIIPDNNPKIAIIISSCKYRMNIIVDRGRVDDLAQVSWYARTPDGRGRTYFIRLGSINKRPYGIYLHRVIAGWPIGMFVDHINGDCLDNRAANLRIVDRSTNFHNQTRLRHGKTSQYLGVSFSRTHKKWISFINHNNQRVNLGLFDSEYEAHLAYQSKKRELLGSLFIR